jgi:hypothetical protein
MEFNHISVLLVFYVGGIEIIGLKSCFGLNLKTGILPSCGTVVFYWKDYTFPKREFFYHGRFDL